MATSIGGTGVLSVLGTLFVSLLEDDNLVSLYNHLFATLPKLPLYFSVFLISFTYLAVSRWVLLRRDQNRIKEEHEKELRSVNESKDRELRQLIESNREVQRQLTQQCEAEISQAQQEIKKVKEICTSLEGRVEKEKKQNEELLQKLLKAEKDCEVVKKEMLEVTESKEKIIDEMEKVITEKDMELKSQKEKIDRTVSVDNDKKWNHNVLVVDDDSSNTALLKRKLVHLVSGIHVDTALEIPDSRFAADYEIVISDVFDCATEDVATSVLNTIKSMYPYKFVYAMSNQPAACRGIDVDGKIIQKDPKRKQHCDEIVKIVVECCKKLNDIHGHWDEVERKLQINNVSDKQILLLKSFYYSFVKRMQYYY